jgi:hypothetical protein
VAVSSSNTTGCATLNGSYAYGCYSAIALNTKNAKLCTSISNYTYEAGCTLQVANATGSYEDCTSLLQPYRDSCLYSIGSTYNSTAACSQISDPNLSATCKYAIDLSKADSHSNSTYCSLIGNGTFAQSSEILNSTPALKTDTNFGNLPLLIYYYDSYLNLQVSPRDLCYYSLAYQSNESSYCASISNSTLRSICTKSYAINTTPNSTGYYQNISSICGRYGASCSNLSYIDAIYSKNATKCFSSNKTQSAICYSYLASFYSNTSYCQYIGNATLNGACVNNVLYRNSTNSTV